MVKQHNYNLYRNLMKNNTSTFLLQWKKEIQEFSQTNRLQDINKIHYSYYW